MVSGCHQQDIPIVVVAENKHRRREACKVRGVRPDQKRSLTHNLNVTNYTTGLFSTTEPHAQCSITKWRQWRGKLKGGCKIAGHGDTRRYLRNLILEQ